MGLRFLAVLWLVAMLSASVQAEKPNIILVMADDQGWGDTGYNGHRVVKTPNLDAMAKEALVFNRFYAAAPVCSPTRGSVLTGRHPIRIKITNTGRTDFPATTSDMLPTLLSAAEVQRRGTMPLDGIDLMPMIQGKTATREESIGFWSSGLLLEVGRVSKRLYSLGRSCASQSLSESVTAISVDNDGQPVANHLLGIANEELAVDDDGVVPRLAVQGVELGW